MPWFIFRNCFSVSAVAIHYTYSFHHTNYFNKETSVIYENEKRKSVGYLLRPLFQCWGFKIWGAAQRDAAQSRYLNSVSQIKIDEKLKLHRKYIRWVRLFFFKLFTMPERSDRDKLTKDGEYCNADYEEWSWNYQNFLLQTMCRMNQSKSSGSGWEQWKNLSRIDRITRIWIQVRTFER